MKKYKIKRRFLSLLLVLCMTAVTPVTVLAGSNDALDLDADEGLGCEVESFNNVIILEPTDDFGTAKGSCVVSADGDGTEPNAIQDTYTVTTNDGVTTHFYKVNTNNFAIPNSQMEFYDAMLNATIIDPENPGYTEANDINIRKAWLKVASSILLDKSYSGRNHKACNYMAGAADYWDYEPRSERGTAIPFNSAASLKVMEQELMKYMPYNSGNDVLNRCGLFQDDKGAQSGPVFYQAGLGTEYGDEKADGQYIEFLHSINAVVFSDFKVSPILPDASIAGNYITEKVSDVTKENTIVATKLKNDTNEVSNGDQSIEDTDTATVSSEINGSTSYEWSEGLTVGVEYGFTDLVKTTIEASFSASQTVKEGWTEGKSKEHERKKTHSVSATMPPYTGAILNQVKGSQKFETTYNCPVALTFTVRMLHYDERHRYCDLSWKQCNECLGASSSVVTFSPNAQKDLFNRYKEKNYNTDKDGVKWSNYGDNWSWAGVSGEICKKALSYAKDFAPIASTSATFIETVNTVDTEIKGMAPLRPLNYVQLVDPKNDARKRMEPGESFRVDTIEVEGKNEKDGDYYGFNPKYGKWILTDEDGKEITDGSIATLTENKRNKVLTLNAVAPGTVYLDYLIDEDKYSTYYDSSTFATNASLAGHPVIEVTIAGTPVTGVTLDPSKLTLKEGEKDDLTATVAPNDATDKTVTWTAADPKVATVADGKVTAVAAGKTKVTVTTKDGGKTATADITVKYATPTAAQTEETLTGLVAGGKYKINGTEYTADSAGTIKVDKAWHNKEISIVRTASDSDLNSDAQKLTIVEKPVAVEGVTLDPSKLTIAEGLTGKLTAVIAPEEATNKDVTWAIADPKVATVADGTVTGVAAGKTKVTVTTLDGEKTATADVTVKYATPSAKQTKENFTGLVANAEYQINGTKYTADDAGTIAVDKEWYGKEITIVRVNADADLNSDGQKLKIKDPSKKDPTPGNLISLKKVKINSFKSSLPYTGEAVKQSATLTYGSGKTKVTLTEGKDYTVTYKNNYDLGTATVIYEATDDDDAQYTDKVEKTFKITGKYTLITDGKEENCTVTLVNDEYPYANGAIKPEVTVTVLLVNNEGETEERTLEPGKDFTVSYKNNKNVAAADAVNPKNGKDVAPQVIVKGKGNYVFADTDDMKKGVVRRFAITQCDLSELVLTASDVVYNKTAGKYKNTKIQFFDKDYRDMKLKVKKDYTVEFETSDDSEAPAAGQTVTATITAVKDESGNYKGNYEGTVTATYRVVDKKENLDISKAKVLVNPDTNGKVQPCAYTGSAIEPGQEGQPELKVTFGSGKNLKTLTAGEDFEILGYYNNIKAGKNAIILVKGINTFYGTKAVKFQIK